LLRKQPKTLGGYFFLPHPVDISYWRRVLTCNRTVNGVQPNQMGQTNNANFVFQAFLTCFLFVFLWRNLNLSVTKSLQAQIV